MPVDLAGLRAFDFAGADKHLWVFKQSTSQRKFSAHYVATDDRLNANLAEIATSEMQRIAEFQPYSHLAETNEGGCLTESEENTDFALLKLLVDRPEVECRARGIKDLQGSTGYIAKFVINGDTVYAVKRSTTSWRTKYPKNFINMTFSNGVLTAAEDTTFSIERNFDFYCRGDQLYIANKRGFELAIKYAASYATAFEALRHSPSFQAMFADLGPLVAYVGKNSMQLRRMAAVQEKALFDRLNFLQTLQGVSAAENWGINFDPVTGKIIACEDTARIILKALLDHRLTSKLTLLTYDVPHAVQV